MVSALRDIQSEQDRNVLAGHMALWGFQDYAAAEVTSGPRALQYVARSWPRLRWLILPAACKPVV